MMSIVLFQSVNLLGESTSGSLFIKVSWGAILLSGLSFLLLGVLAGWLIWGAYQGRAKSIEKKNSLLSSGQEERESAFSEHREKYRK